MSSLKNFLLNWWKKSLLRRFLALLAEKLFSLEIKLMGKVKPRFRYRILPGTDSDNQYFTAFLQEETKVLFMTMPKVASTSIKRTFFESEAVRVQLDEKKRAHSARLGIQQEDYFHSDDIFLSVFKWNEFGEETLRQNINKMKGAYYDRQVGFFNKQKFAICGYYPTKGWRLRRVDANHINQYFIFTFVRNPFVRFVSGFVSKYELKKKEDEQLTFRNNCLPYMRRVLNIEDLSRKIQQIPHAYINPHLVPQHFILDQFKKQGGKIDFIGKLEKIDKEFEPIRKKYGLLNLEMTNASGASKKWQEYYTPETASRVYETFREDFARFGYEHEYPKLLNYLEKKSIG